MFSSSNELEAVELSIKVAQEKVNKLNSLEKLLKNRDFKNLVLEGYFKEEAIRLVMAKSNPALSADTEQDKIITSINSIGEFSRYLSNTEQFGRMAKAALKEDEHTREELIQESM